MSSEHNVNVVRICDIEKHPDADTLGITYVDGRPCIVRLSDFKTGDLAIYVPVDSVVPTNTPSFTFLADRAKKDKFRVRAMRLRGIFSMGLIIPLPKCPACSGHGGTWGDENIYGSASWNTCQHCDGEGVEPWDLGDEVSAQLGITVYEPPEVSASGGSFSGGRTAKDPGILPVYDIESARKYHRLLDEGEEIVLTEKIHGANARFVFHDGRLHVGSRNQFKDKDGGGMWWNLAIANDLESKLSQHPDIAIYGEAYGQVQDLKYGLDGHQLIVFDVLDVKTRRWFNYDEMTSFADALGLRTVPELWRGRWFESVKDELWQLAEGTTTVNGATHVREGWVLKPVVERFDRRLGRVIMKLHGEGYLTRKGG